MANNDTDNIINEFMNLDVCLHDNNHVGALAALTKIINYLKRKLRKDNAAEKQQIVYNMMKRIYLNFENGYYKDVVDDFNFLIELGETVDKNKDLFIMKEHAFIETIMKDLTSRFEQAQVECKLSIMILQQ
ncbi:unnamed protein product [Rotaria sp. Silwood1]|nr:unnamed protein product [Rotaria sp. Silwood1]CAF1688062.1 unnamed protein product [Rotaria sp. Silwood1]